jgi:divalent metal cation (Fe/Co/Zn/Cd) transporter
VTADPLLFRRGLRLEYVTLVWNVFGVAILAWTAVAARSVALAGFGIDSLIEIGASIVVVWELTAASGASGASGATGVTGVRRDRALRLIGAAFALLAVYLLVQGALALGDGHRAGHSPVGIGWTACTAAIMFALAWGKARTGAALGNPVLRAEGRVTMVDGILATAVLCGLVLDAALGWWWADPVAGFVLVFYAARECRAIFAVEHAT